MRAIKQLTRTEFQVMATLWNLPEGKGGCTGDILEKYEGSKPAYTTLATFLKILTNKGFVRCKKRDNKLFYTPIISQEDYAKVYITPIRKTFFHESFTDMFRYIIDLEKPTADEIDQAIELLQARK